MANAPIFISYRRDDARGWPGRIAADLARVFGADKVFMDTRDIAPGAEFPLALQQELEHCVVLLALIGPDWERPRTDGGQPPGDWVHHELHTALRRQVLVVPVLLGRADLPRAQDVPDDLSALLQRHALALGDPLWDAGLSALIEAIAAKVPPDPVGDITIGLRRIAALPAEAAQRIGRSEAELRAICRISAELAARKRIHDLLHSIEKLCLKSMQEMPEASNPQPYALDLERAAGAIELALGAANLPPSMGEEIRTALGNARASFEVLLQWSQPVAGIAPGVQQAERRTAAKAVIRHLNRVLSKLSNVNAYITEAARHLPLDELRQVLADLPPRLTGPSHAAARCDIAADAGKLDSIARELEWRVEEHDELQTFDNDLRTLCDKRGGLRGPAAPAPAEWSQVQRHLDELEHSDVPPKPLLRASLADGHCGDLRAVVERLRSLDRQIAAGELTPRQLNQALHATHASLAEQFNHANSELMPLCARLGDLGESLKRELDRLGGL